MLISINAAGETLYPLIVTTDRSTLGVFRDAIEENVDLKVHVGQSASVDLILFHGYLRDVLIPRIENFREANETPDSPAILFMDNCSSRVPEDIGCPTSCVSQRAMREAAPHARGLSKARQDKTTLRRLAAVKTRYTVQSLFHVPFPLFPFPFPLFREK
jgi:hypothetical protein